ncbi:energy transducer TonB [Vibrio sp. ZSDE26]|uniref:Protein TonB n=1 Tax=Vibrio amylolyticus TaxID=2847292 RepID=A0A9X1XL91_9VIBR|nr:energy transducer TonB [Vibrio amylolyticus]MCK6261669.1 energy transducer TonB [Vibrio amylolyticus]
MPRVIIAIPIALIVALGLFSFMAWMVQPKYTEKAEQTEPLRFDMVMVEEESLTERRRRAVPEPPEPLEPPPQVPTSRQQVQSQDMSHTALEMPTLEMETSVQGLQISLPSIGDVSMDQNAMPLHRVEPTYPARALRRGLEGYVVMHFSIDELGRPTEIEVVEANPPRQFEREAIRALKRWKYQPKVVNDKAVVQQGQSVKLEFKLQK